VRVGGWSFLSRGECHIRLGDCPGIKPISEAEDHSWSCYLHVDDAKTLYEEILRKGGEVWHEIADKPWGMREFVIVTPDGHRIVFGQQL
jgi:predicted enzyme related to lactoylglutathione lyase